MRLSKSELEGTGKVFKFTLVQFFKNKANIVSMAILLLFSLASMPLMSLAGGGAEKREQSGILAVYFSDETDCGLTAEKVEEALREDGYFSETRVLAASDDVVMGESDVTARVFESEEAGYVIDILCVSEDAVDEYDISMLHVLLTSVLSEARYAALDISPEQLEVLTAPYNVEISSVEEYLETVEEDYWSTNYWLQLFYSIIVMMVSIFAVSYIIRAVVEEKASKLVEFLMVNIKPLALIFGKVLAAMVFTLCNFAMLITGTALSYVISKRLFDVSSVSAMIEGYGVSLDFLNISPVTIVSVIISLLLGYVTFSILAGLSGTGCSAMEDMQGAQTLSMVLIMGGYIFALFASAFENDTFILICCLLPVLSLYCAPVQYIVGEIGFGTLCISWVLQIAVIVLLLLFTAKIYETLLMHRGNRVTLRQMLKMARLTSKKEAR